MRNFGKCMWYGVKAFYKENREELCLLAAILISALVVGVIGIIFEMPKELLLIAWMIVCSVSVWVVKSYFHYKEAMEYSEEHHVSFEQAWEKTRTPEGYEE